MEKVRVSYNERYYYLKTEDGQCIVVDYRFERGTNYNNEDFESGNYFATEARALAALDKIYKVLKGADVIEVPSEEEIKERLNIIIPTNPIEPWCVEGCCKHIIEWLKSKIVK